MALVDSRRIYKVLALSVWAFNESAETYGSEVVTDRVETFTVTPQYDTDTARSFGVPRDLLAVYTQDQFALTHVGMNAAELAAITGRTYDESGSPVDNRARRAKAGDDHPYFGLGVILATQGGGSIKRLYPRCKMMGDGGLSMDATNQFVRPQLTFHSAILKLADGTEYDIWYEEDDDGILTLDSDFLTAVDALRTRTTS